MSSDKQRESTTLWTMDGFVVKMAMEDKAPYHCGDSEWSGQKKVSLLCRTAQICEQIRRSSHADMKEWRPSRRARIAD